MRHIGLCLVGLFAITAGCSSKPPPAPQPVAVSAPKPPPKADAPPCETGSARVDGVCKPITECAPTDKTACTEACNASNAPSCLNLAKLVYADDKTTALSLADKACGLSFAPGCSHAGLWREHTSPDRPRLLAKACELGSATDCRVVGSDIIAGRTAGDKAEGMRLLEKACTMGERYGCKALGWAQASEGRWTDAAATLDRGCQSGQGDACSTLGGFYLQCSEGRMAGMVPADMDVCKKFPSPDTNKAVAILGKACLEGTMPGVCQTVGGLTRQGKGVKKDPAQALKYYEAGCAKGGFNTCEPLADMYQKGEGTAKDPKKAKEVLDGYCTNPASGSMMVSRGRACMRLSQMHQTGAKPDKALARERLAWGCKHGYLKACDALGQALEKEGKKDEAKALYEDHCSRLRDEPMCKALVKLGGTPAHPPSPRPDQDKVSH